MLNPNSQRANTVISQSFIASQFQGFNDPFVKTQPTSSLNQFVRSKQTSDSGIFQQTDNQSFGFGNITANHQPKQLQTFSRKANEVIQVNVLPNLQTQTNQQFQHYAQQNQHYPQQNQQYTQQNNANLVNGQQVNYSQKQTNKMVPPQQLQQRYISPGIGKADSPTKTNQFQQQPQRPQQPPMNVQPGSNQPNQTNDSFMKLNQSQSQTQSQSQSQNYSIQQSRAQSSFNQNQNQNQNQKSQKQLDGSLASNQQGLDGSSIGKRLKLNVSQQFSNSFVLNCVNQPQKSTILTMKQRQREYRKSIQNFFV